MEIKSIKVKIFGNEYPLKGESEELTIQIANYVDMMLKNIHSKISDQPPLTIAILAALNITEELFREKENKETPPNQVSEELNSMIKFLDTFEKQN